MLRCRKHPYRTACDKTKAWRLASEGRASTISNQHVEIHITIVRFRWKTKQKGEYQNDVRPPFIRLTRRWRRRPRQARGDALKLLAVRRSCGVGEENTCAQVEAIGRAAAEIAKDRRPKLFEDSHDARIQFKGRQIGSGSETLQGISTVDCAVRHPRSAGGEYGDRLHGIVNSDGIATGPNRGKARRRGLEGRGDHSSQASRRAIPLGRNNWFRKWLKPILVQSLS